MKYRNDREIPGATGGNLDFKPRILIPERCVQCGSSSKAIRKVVGRLVGGGLRSSHRGPCPHRWHDVR